MWLAMEGDDVVGNGGTRCGWQWRVTMWLAREGDDVVAKDGHDVLGNGCSYQTVRVLYAWNDEAIGINRLRRRGLTCSRTIQEEQRRRG